MSKVVIGGECGRNDSGILRCFNIKQVILMKRMKSLEKDLYYRKDSLVVMHPI